MVEAPTHPQDGSPLLWCYEASPEGQEGGKKEPGGQLGSQGDGRMDRQTDEQSDGFLDGKTGREVSGQERRAEGEEEEEPGDGGRQLWLQAGARPLGEASILHRSLAESLEQAMESFLEQVRVFWGVGGWVQGLAALELYAAVLGGRVKVLRQE